MGSPVVHFEVLARGDARELQEFYKGLFGWQINTGNPIDYGVVDTESSGRGINGGIASVGEGEVPGAIFYVEVADPKSVLEAAVEKGGKVLLPVMTIPGMVTFAKFADPEGNAIGLVKSEAPA